MEILVLMTDRQNQLLYPLGMCLQEKNSLPPPHKQSISPCQSALPNNSSNSMELQEGFLWGSAITQWNYAGRGFSRVMQTKAKIHAGQAHYEKMNFKKVATTYLSQFPCRAPGMKPVRWPSCITNTPAPHETQVLSSPRSPVTDLYNEKKEGCHKTKQIFTFSCSTVQYSHHPSLAKEKESSKSGVSEMAMEQRRGLPQNTIFTFLCHVQQSSPACEALV